MSRKNKPPQERLFPNGQTHESLDAIESVGPADQGEAAEPERVRSEDLEFDVGQLEGADSPPARIARSSGFLSGVAAGNDNGTPEQPWHNTAGAPDPFDPATLRLSQSFGASAGVKKALLTVPVRKPDKSWFVRVHPDQNYRLQTAVIELKEDRETYLVAPALWPELATEATFRPKLLATAVNRQGVVFLWEANLPRADGRVDEWTRTSLEAVELSTRRWVRIVANMSLGAYDVFEATGQLSEPEWPTVPFRELLRVAFKDRLIDRADHPVLRRLRGEA